MERPVFSEMLSERRRELGYSIGQASRVLRLREDVLIAFEEGDFDGMPKSGYAQGMLSSYARYLGLDAGVVIEAYLADYDAYKREIRRRGRGRSSGLDASDPNNRVRQPRVPRVPSKGLLPTSGGYAGDMGSFATTRVHTRMQDPESSPAEEDTYPQGRPYTTKAPTQGRRGYGGERRGSGDIQTLNMDYSQYDDDLRIEREAMPYAAASSQQGRRRTTQGGRENRPQVNRRSTNQNTRSRRNGVASRGGGNLSLFTGSSNKILFAIAAIAVVLVIVVVISVGSYVNKSTPPKSVPVTTSQQQNDKSTQQQTSTNKQGTDTAKSSTDGSKSSETSANTQPDKSNSNSDVPLTDVNVTVTVADGAVTWLEISNDGKSEIAETVTGPWNKSFRVQEVITIQAGDTSVVTVMQDGKQVQFESMASGIGTIRIQGPGKKVEDKRKQDGQSDTSQTEDAGTDDTSSAKMGNESSASTQSNGTGQTYDTTFDETDPYAYGYDNATEYTEYSNGYSTEYDAYSYDYSGNGY